MGTRAVKMPNTARDLPDFDRPPVTEVALAVQFEPLDVSPAHLGMLALRMRELGYKRIEQQPPLQPVVERFPAVRGSSQVVLEMGLPTVRHWFMSVDGNRLVQIQPDRFIHNWRKVESGDKYPRYETIRETFRDRLAEFATFIEEHDLGKVMPNQVEVTYVNHVRPGGEQSMCELAAVVGIAGNSYADRFLPTPESARAAASYVIARDGAPIGRLHVNTHTAFDLERQEPIVVVNLTARGAPLSTDIDGVLGFMDLGREWVVRGFADITTPAMHATWERKQ